jgi:hypothetical protein
MSSAQSTSEELRKNKLAALTQCKVNANIHEMDAKSVLAAVESFEQLGYLLNKVPMTREQREDVDQHLVNISPVFNQ